MRGPARAKLGGQMEPSCVGIKEVGGSTAGQDGPVPHPSRRAAVGPGHPGWGSAAPASWPAPVGAWYEKGLGWEGKLWQCVGRVKVPSDLTSRELGLRAPQRTPCLVL